VHSQEKKYACHQTLHSFTINSISLNNSLSPISSSWLSPPLFFISASPTTTALPSLGFSAAIIVAIYDAYNWYSGVVDPRRNFTLVVVEDVAESEVGKSESTVT